MPQTPARARSGFTGWHMTVILTAFFGVVFVVNFTMALSAIAWRRLDTGDVRRQAIAFAAGGAGHFRSRSRLDAGGWRLRLTAIAGNRQWHAMASL